MKKLILTLCFGVALSFSAFAENGKQIKIATKMNFEKNKAIKPDARFFRKAPVMYICDGNGSGRGSMSTWENGGWVFVYYGELDACVNH